MIKDIRIRQTNKIYGVTILCLGWCITHLNDVLSLTGGEFRFMCQKLQSLDFDLVYIAGDTEQVILVFIEQVFIDTLRRTTGGKINFF